MWPALVARRRGVDLGAELQYTKGGRPFGEGNDEAVLATWWGGRGSVGGISFGLRWDSPADPVAPRRFPVGGGTRLLLRGGRDTRGDCEHLWAGSRGAKVSQVREKVTDGSVH